MIKVPYIVRKAPAYTKYISDIMWVEVLNLSDIRIVIAQGEDLYWLQEEELTPEQSEYISEAYDEAKEYLCLFEEW